MNPYNNYYATLHVRREAGQIEIAAAYRALMSKYSAGSYPREDVAITRRDEIEAAYSILSNADHRTAYDEARGAEMIGNLEAEIWQDEDTAKGTPDWDVVTKYYPAAEACRLELKSLSPELSLTYQIELLSKKQFENAERSAKQLQTEFLGTYFSRNASAQQLGKTFLQTGRFELAVRLNGVLRALGSPASNRGADFVISFCVQNSVPPPIHIFDTATLIELLRNCGYRVDVSKVRGEERYSSRREYLVGEAAAWIGNDPDRRFLGVQLPEDYFRRSAISVLESCYAEPAVSNPDGLSATTNRPDFVKNRSATVKVEQSNSNGANALGEPANGATTGPIERKQKSNWFRRFWSGDYPLVAMFWGYFVFNLVIAPKNSYMDPKEAEATDALFIVIFLPLHVLWLTGLWQSSNKYSGPRIWAFLAKLYVAISGLSIVAAALFLTGVFAT